MTEKKKALQWLKESNKMGEDAGFIKSFEEGLSKAIEKEKEVITTWMFGYLLFKDEKYYKARWNSGKFTVEELSEAEAKHNNIGERSITTFEKEINQPNNSSDNVKDTTWFKEIEDIYHTFSLIVDEKYTPGSKQEVDNAKIEVEKLKSKYSGDPEFDKEIAYLDALLDESLKRKFVGSKFTIIGIFLGILFMFYMSNKVEIQSGKLLIDKAEDIQQGKIVKLERKADMARKEIDYESTPYNNLKKEIADLKSQEQTNQIKERIVEREKQLKQYENNTAIREKTIKDSEKEIAFLKSMTAEEYRDYKVSSDQEAADSVSGYAWTTILWFILYIAAAFPFVFTINKRNLREKKSNWLKIAGMLLGSARTVRYKRSDGSTYDDNSQYLGAFATAIALPVAAIVITIVLLPYIATIVFARNIVIPYFYSI